MHRLARAALTLLLLAAPAQACTFAWQAPTTNTDGTPLTDLAGYHLYLLQPGATTPALQVVGTSVRLPADARSATLPCKVGTYTLKALNTAGVESKASNSVPITQPDAPAAFTLTP